MPDRESEHVTRWRKKPVVIEARQFLPEKHRWESSIALAEWCGGTFYPGSPSMWVHDPWLIIPTLEGDMRAEPGDWIIRGVKGEFAPFGVDIDPQPRYPYPFHQGDVLDVLDSLASGRGVLFTLPQGGAVELFDEQIAAHHGSPPCQAFTLCQRIQGNEHPELVEPTRERFKLTGRPWIIENVEGAPLVDPVTLCGAMFGLETYQHRLFESNIALEVPWHPEHTVRTTKMGRTPRPGEFMHVVGNFSGVDRAREVMEMPWASRDGLREAIPPAYTHWLGEQLIQHTQEMAA